MLRHRLLRWACALATLLMLAVGTFGGSAAADRARPNFVVINVDDLDERAVSLMPGIREALIEEGLVFGQSFVTTPVCCPSRASFLRGQYAHNHGVLTNGGDFGGFTRFRDLGREESTIATWLQEAGYRTGMVGKYMNEYNLSTAGLHVPPGWDHWYAKIAGGTYYDYSINDAGGRVRFGSRPGDYRTDVEARRLLELVDLARTDDRPFFLYWAPVAPHTTGGKGTGALPPTPAPRHVGAFAGVRAPNVCAFNEQDMSDKPGFLRNRPMLSAAERREIDEEYRARLESMLSVDEAITDLIAELDRVGLLGNTYVVFTSDNGFHQGEHRIPTGKETPYEESLRVPLIIRGPGVARGAVTDATALNLDLAPTLADLAGVRAPRFVDGRSLARVLRDPGRTPASWRNGFLAQSWEGTFGDATFRAVRSADAKLVVRLSREVERYDLKADAYEMDSLGAGALGGGMAALFGALDGALPDLVDCSGRRCRRLEAGLPGYRTPSIRVLLQNGNESLRRGERLQLRWSSAGVERVKIELLRDAKLFRTITDSTPSDGTFRWRVPEDLPLDGRYKVRIKDIVPTVPRIKDAGDAAAFAR